MKRIIGCFLAIAMMISIITVPGMAVNASNKFDDVDKTKWYVPYIDYVVEYGLMSGTGQTEFSPDLTVSRAQFVQTLYALAKKPTVTKKSKFQDLREGAYYIDAVNWAAETKVAAGLTDARFGPDEKVTREQAATFFMAFAKRVLQIKAKQSADLSDYPDYQSIANYAVKSMEWAVGAGLISGMKQGNKTILLAPKTTLTRAQLATMLKALHQFMEKEGVIIEPSPSPIVNPTVQPSSSQTATPTAEPSPKHTVSPSNSPAPQPSEEPTDEEKEDKDKDDVPDYIEEYFSSSPSSDDTDGDGLSDYIEIFTIKTDPTNVDSDGNGIQDGDEDADADGLSNNEEVRLGTDLTNTDSDSDGLSDAEEVNKYYTDPLKYDTDEDGLCDGDEILLGLDPLKAKTDGKTADSERELKQKLDQREIADELLTDNSAVPSVEGTVAGNINRHVSLDEADIDALSDNRAVIGKPVSLETDYSSGELIISFAIEEENERTPYYMICNYDDGEILPCETSSGENRISTKAEEGQYFVVDAERLLIDLGIPINKYKSMAGSSDSHALTTLSTSYLGSGSAKTKAEKDSDSESMLSLHSTSKKGVGISGQADIVFVIDTTGSMGDAISNVVRNIDDFVDALSSDYSVKANFALIDYKDITCSEETRIIKNGSGNWFDNVEEFKNEINGLAVAGGGDGPETPIDGLAMAEGLDFRRNANKFIILITDADYKNDNNYGISTMEEMAGKLAGDEVVTSVISATGYQSIYSVLYDSTGGVFGNIYGDFKSTLLGLADNIGEIVNDGSWVILSDYQFIKLDKPLDKSGYSSDEDTLSDLSELGNEYESDVMPYIRWVLNQYKVPEDMYEDPTTVTVYKYKSNPVLADTDYDGKNDDSDAYPKDRSISGKLSTNQDITSAVSFEMDYRWFFKDSTVYNHKLSTASLLMATVVYGNKLEMKDIGNHDTTTGTSFEEVAKYLGLSEPTKISIDTDDYHRSEVGLGFRNVKYQGKNRIILAVVVRGTNGTIEEWSSNFDIGDSSTFDSESEWTHIKNHKGFDITANRLHRIVNDYIEKNELDPSKIVYWVTGHSRGAAIANIMGANYEKEGKADFTYTFASPNTTLDENAGSYQTIFNIVNTDDFVPCLPMSGWGYTRYGKSASASIRKEYEKEWETLTGKWDYDPDTLGMDTTIAELEKILSGNPEVECYKYTCSDHGDGSNDTITITNRGTSKESRENAIGKIPQNALPYCIIERKDGNLIAGWDFTVCQTPAYFMQILAATICEKIDKYRFVVELNIADRYEKAKGAIIRTSIGGINHPHYTETYYLLSKHMTSTQFE